jgi:hypothetical protein
MALIKCEECQREISDKAESCPGCGYRRPLEFNVEIPNFREMYPHPGPMPTIYSKSVKDRFGEIGMLAGRTLEEISLVVGPADTLSIGGPGIKVAEWNKYSVFGGGYHIALIFDQNDVCGGVSYENAY